MSVLLRRMVISFIGLTVVSMSWAQSQRYTWRDLSKPASAIACERMIRLNDQGDVLGMCTFKGGTRKTKDYWLGEGINLFPYYRYTTWYYEKPIVWAANGTTRLLETPVRSSIYSMGITNTGRVLASVYALNSSGLPEFQLQNLSRQGTSLTSTPLTIPADIGARPVSILYVLKNGTIGLAADTERNATWRISSAGLLLPPLPVLPANPTTVVDFENNRCENEQGFSIQSRQFSITPSSSTPWVNTAFEYWFNDGASWQEIKVSNNHSINHFNSNNSNNSNNRCPINARGQVLLETNLGVTTNPNSVIGYENMEFQLWTAGAGSIVLPQGRWSRLNDTGVVIGEIASTIDKAGSHGATYVNGQLTDLNKVTSNVPYNKVLRTPLDINNKGQIVGWSTDSSVANGAIRLVVLTPQ